MPNQESKRKIDLSARKISAGWPKVGYDGDENNGVLQFYARGAGAKKDRKSMFHGKKLADIFIHAMALGKQVGLTGDYNKKSDRKDSIDMEYIAINPEYLWMMISVALVEAEKNGIDPLEIFENPRERIIDVCERYANYGIDLLMYMDKKATTSDPYAAFEEKFKETLEQMDD